MCLYTQGCTQDYWCLDLLALELQVVVSYQMQMLGTKLRSSAKTVHAPNPWAVLSATWYNPLKQMRRPFIAH